MKHKTVNVSGGKIEIFDDVFDFATREKFYYYFRFQNFTTSGADTSTLEHKGDFNLYCSVDEEKIASINFLNSGEMSKIIAMVDGMSMKQSRINLSTLNDRNRFHTDTYGDLKTKTLLYYPNLTWQNDWGGYTIFSDSMLSEVEYTSFYVPGRIILFDGNIPHCIAPPTSMAPTYRFSFVIQYGAPAN